MLFEIGEIISRIGGTILEAKESMDEISIMSKSKKFVDDFTKGNKRGESKDLLVRVFVEKYNKKGTTLSLLDVKRMLIQYAPRIKTNYYEVKRIYEQARRKFIYYRGLSEDDIAYTKALDKIRDKDCEYELELLNKIKCIGTIDGKLKETWPSEALAYMAVLLDKYGYEKGEVSLLVQQLAYDDEVIAKEEQGERAFKEYKAEIRRERQMKKKQQIKNNEE